MCAVLPEAATLSTTTRLRGRDGLVCPVQRLQLKVDLIRSGGEGVVLAEETLNARLQLLAPLLQLAHFCLQLVQAVL